MPLVEPVTRALRPCQFARCRSWIVDHGSWFVERWRCECQLVEKLGDSAREKRVLYVRGDFCQRFEHEQPFVQARMRQSKFGSLHDSSIEEQ